MKKVMLVFGTRPEAIKMCPLVNEMKTREELKTVVCVTGQHRQMLDQVLDAFHVTPDYDLAIMKDKQTLVKVFYAYKDTKVTTITSIGAILVNVGLNLVLSKFWGINGLAIATSIAAALQCLVLYIVLHRKIGDFGLKTTLITLCKVLIAGAVMYVAVSMLYKVLIQQGLSELVGLFICVFAGVVIYGLCSILLKVTIPLALFGKIKGRRKGVKTS